MTEAHAITLCLKNRDTRGFEFLVKKYRREAFFHALGFLQHSEEAVDACQEAFTRAFLKMPTLKRLDAFYPWFYTILRNHCLNLISKREIKRKYERNEKIRQGQVQGPEPFEQRELSEEVQYVLGQMKTEHREILVLKHLLGHNYSEIAQLLKIPRGTVMSRLYNARKSFAELMNRKGGCHDGL